MEITVKLFGRLRRHLESGQEVITVQLDGQNTVNSVVQILGIDDTEIWLARSNGRAVPKDTLLQRGDVVELYSVIGGG